jgi:hypothetical protein
VVPHAERGERPPLGHRPPQWIDGREDGGTSIRPPEYPLDVARERLGENETIVQAPPNAAALDVQLSLGFMRTASCGGTARLCQIEPPHGRVIRAMTSTFGRGIRLRVKPTWNSSPPSCVRPPTRHHLLSRGMTVVGTGRNTSR